MRAQQSSAEMTDLIGWLLRGACCLAVVHGSLGHFGRGCGLISSDCIARIWTKTQVVGIYAQAPVNWTVRRAFPCAVDVSQ